MTAIRQRVYRGLVDTPKTDQSLRKAALSKGLLTDVENWRSKAADREGWVFPSEAMTPLSKDNCWRRNMQPDLAAAGLGWVNFSGDASDACNLDEGVGRGWEAGG